MVDLLNFDELKASGKLPSPKGVALAVMQLCQQENISLHELAHTILADPVLAGNIIKMANAVNPNRNRPIASVTIDTLILIGIQAVRQAVLGFSLVSDYRKGSCKQFNYTHFWSHSTAMGCAAQAVGSVVRIAPIAEIFTCGLLAEIGQLALASARPEAYSELLNKFAEMPLKDLMQAECQEFGMGRRALVAAMMKDWGMPQLFIDVVSSYDDIQAGGFGEGSRHINLALALQLAAQLANVYLAPLDERDAMMVRVFEIGTALNLNAERVVAIANLAAHDWLEWGRLLNIRSVAMPEFVVPETDTDSYTAA